MAGQTAEIDKSMMKSNIVRRLMMSGWKMAILVGILLMLAFAAPAAAQETPLPFAVRETPAPVETLAPPTRATPEPTEPPVERPFALGDTGEDVLAFKLRLQVLGYFRDGVELSDKISEKTLERVNQFLADNGMEAVEIVTLEIQEMIMTRDDLAIVETPAPTPTPEPIITPQGTPELPAHDADGFLTEADEEFVFADDADGLWYYMTDSLYINIRRYTDTEEENVWFETEVKTRGDERMLSFINNTIYTYRTPVFIAQENSAVLAFTDDFFAKRKYGIAIRDGEIYRDYIRKTSSSFPLGDSLAVFADGTLRAYDYSEYSAEEFLNMGAVHVLSFGPWLIQNGVTNERVLSDTYMHYHEPRCAIGMIEPNHYFILTVDGRYDGANGVYMSWLAARMQEVGVTEALNLDGGGTTALIFMGTPLSRVGYTNDEGTNARRVSSMLGFGISDTVPEP